ncbi:MAG: hypothetical protein HY508_05490 [Acidobacteria bacterium]|nr:hypothetical protein [Acidobacteriota bacterium]
MAAVNKKRVALGVLLGGLAWGIWSMVVNGLILASHYATAQEAGQLLKAPRYPLFLVYWFLGIFIFTYILTWIYLSLRETLGPGPKTALRMGFLVGFTIAFPVNLSVASWVPIDRVFPMWWMLDLWVGAVLATFISAALYKDA